MSLYVLRLAGGGGPGWGGTKWSGVAGAEKTCRTIKVYCNFPPVFVIWAYAKRTFFAMKAAVKSTVKGLASRFSLPIWD